MKTNRRTTDSRKAILKQGLGTIKANVELNAWASLEDYFGGAGNGTEAKIAVVTLGIMAKELQAKNNSRQLDLIELKMGLHVGSGQKRLVGGTAGKP